MSVIMNDKSDDLIIRFLLGELSEEEQAQVEERFLSDNEFFEEVLSAEDDLIDQYLLGQLRGERRERAEALFRSSARQSRELEFTRELMASLREADAQGNQAASALQPAASAGPDEGGDAEEDSPPADPNTEHSGDTFSLIPTGFQSLTQRLIWLAIALLCFSLLAWFLYLYSSKKGSEERRVGVERNNQETQQPKQPPAESPDEAQADKQTGTEKEKQEKGKEVAAQAPPSRKPNRVGSILLTPAAPERGGDSKTLILKNDGRQIQLQLSLDKSWHYARYSVVLTTFDGRRVWSKESLDAGEASNGRLSFVLPPSLLEYEDYRIELKGLSESGAFVHVADYVFKVRK